MPNTLLPSQHALPWRPVHSHDDQLKKWQQLLCFSYFFRYSIVARENSLSPSEDDLVNRVDVNHSLENGSEVISDLVTDLKRLRTKVVAPQLSTNVSDLKISVSSFCKAFPWHFLTDRNLQITQLGGGFMKLFGRQLTQSGECFRILWMWSI